MPEPKFELYKDQAGKFRFRLVAPNGEIIVTSEAHSSRDACIKGIESVKKNAVIAKTVVDIEKARYLLSNVRAREIRLETMIPINLDGEIIAQKNENGLITLYEVVK